MMRVMAMNLKMEIIFYNQLYNPSDETTFRTVSTSLENNS